jgi:hypothetical protein
MTFPASIRDICPNGFFHITTQKLLPHINNATNAVALLHSLKSCIDLRERLPVSDEFVNLELALHVIINQVRELGAALDSAKSTSLEIFSLASFRITGV